MLPGTVLTRCEPVFGGGTAAEISGGSLIVLLILKLVRQRGY